MKESGEHTVISTAPPNESRVQEFLQGLVLFIILLYFLFYILEFFLNFFLTPQPTAPQLPTTSVAILEGSTLTEKPFAIVLRGGYYDFSYQTTTNLAQLQNELKSGDTFFANILTGKISGELLKANTLILVGSFKLNVASLAAKNSLYSNIITQSNNINAYFNFAESPRGPPQSLTSNTHRKKIFIIGKIEEISIEAGHGESTREIKVLDLGPTESAALKYNEAFKQYERENAEYKFKQQEIFRAAAKELGQKISKLRRK